jgi:two-component system NtrC family sensor kinase
MGGEKILIIDDRRENLLFLADSVLRPEGYEVITAMDGKQGLDKALAEKPDLIITDLKMPRLSGLELLAILRKQNSNTPVILTTFYGSEQAAIEAFRLGAKDYIVKPYEIKDMLASVERSLAEQRLRRETIGLQEGAQVRRHLEERVRQLHSLCGISKAMMGLHNLEEVMRVGVEAAIYLTEASCSQLFLVNRQTHQLELRAVRGPSDSRATCVRQPGTHLLAVEVVQTGKAMLGERSMSQGDKIPCLMVPLRAGGQIVGALGVDAQPSRAFSENDRYLMGLLADLSSVAVANARLIEGLRGDQGPASPVPAEDKKDGDSGLATAPALSESIAQAEWLSSELRDLAATAQVLAANLQVVAGSG